MTEAEWLTCTNPDKILDHLHGQVSERKLRLFACACCRRIQDLLADERSRHAVEVAQRYADGNATVNELYRALKGTEAIRKTKNQAAEQAARHTCFFVPDPSQPEQAGYAFPGEEAEVVVRGVARSCAEAIHDINTAKAKRDAWVAWYTEGKPHVDLLREIVGNPFRPVSVDPNWLAWEDGNVSRLALSLYQERAFDQLPILADALEEAGCTDAALLGHFRGPGAHIPGCWALDLILQRR
jgi:hypothetical protein